MNGPPISSRGVIELVRFFIEHEQLRNGEVTITGSDAHHITRVLRLGPGEIIECVDPEGLLHLVRIEEAGAAVRGKVEETRKGLQESPLHLVLFQGLTKGEKMDLVVQKAVELGAAAIVPFTSRYTVALHNTPASSSIHGQAVRAHALRNGTGPLLRRSGGQVSGGRQGAPRSGRL